MEPLAKRIAKRAAIIKEEGGKYKLYSHEGKVLGTHPSRAKAEAQEAAIEIAKHKGQANYQYLGAYGRGPEQVKYWKKGDSYFISRAPNISLFPGNLEEIDPTQIPRNLYRTAQKEFPLKYRGHMITLHSDNGGGHKAHVHRGNELKFITKRHADPHGAISSAKVWVEDNLPAKDPKPMKKKKAQSFLSDNENSGKMVNAPQELEDLRSQATQLNQKLVDIQTQVASFADALANKLAAEQKLDPQGMMGVQAEVSRLQGELQKKIKDLPETFIKFSDQTVYAKTLYKKLNDPAWSKMIEAAQTRGRGVMKRVAQVLDNISILFQKMTSDIKIKEYGPGEFDEKERKKIIKKNDQNQREVDEFNAKSLEQQPKSQKYFTDVATGRTGIPGT